MHIDERAVGGPSPAAKGALAKRRLRRGTFKAARGESGSTVTKLSTGRGGRPVGGVTLARYDRGGSICLRFSVGSTKGGGRAAGKFKIVGGTGRFGTVRGRGAYRSARRGREGSADLVGRVTRGARRGLPRTCARLASRGVAAFAASARTVTFVPVADSYVDERSATRNYGSSTSLKVDGSPIERSYIRFDARGLTEPVTRAVVRTYLTSGATTTGFSARGVADNGWSESGITYANAPAMGDIVGSSGSVSTGWTSIDVTDLVRGPGLVTVGLTTTSSTSKKLSSRESGAQSPQLLVTTADVTAPSVTLTSPADGSSSSNATPAFSGTAGTAAGDSQTVTVKVYAGGAASGAPVQTLPATAGSGGAYSVTASSALSVGTYTAQAEQVDAAGNTGASAPRSFTILAGDPIVAAAGDIACDPTDASFNGGLGTASACRQKYTSDLVTNAGLSGVLLLGDLQYEDATLAKFNQVFDPTWGRAKSLSRPAVGNHDYSLSGASGYFDYFNGVGNSGGPAGDRSKGYYSFDIGSWHLIALNSNCAAVGGCGAGSPQELWLKSDLAAHPSSCTLAYWHHPRFSSGANGSNTGTATFWQDLYSAHADVILSGHDHDYERFAPQDPTGAADPALGIREFIVGTGGKSHHDSFAAIANSGVRNTRTYGALALTLHGNSYDWRFRPEAGATFTDSGTDVCDGAYSDTAPPSAPSALTATAAGGTQVTLAWSPSTDDDGVAGYKIFRNGSQIATTRTAGYTDTSAQAGTSYNYYVVAYDPSGRDSAASNTAAVTTPASGTTLLPAFAPSDDTYVQADTPSTNYGSADRFVADNSPIRNTLLKFAVSGVSTRRVTSAKLRVYCVDPSTVGGEVHRVLDTSWSEASVVWSTAPAADSTVVTKLGTVTAGQWYEFDVTPLITGDGTFSLEITSPSSDGAYYSSKEGTAGFTPQLLVTVG